MLPHSPGEECLSQLICGIGSPSWISSDFEAVDSQITTVAGHRGMVSGRTYDAAFVQGRAQHSAFAVVLKVLKHPLLVVQLPNLIFFFSELVRAICFPKPPALLEEIDDRRKTCCND